MALIADSLAAANAVASLGRKRHEPQRDSIVEVDVDALLIDVKLPHS